MVIIDGFTFGTSISLVVELGDTSLATLSASMSGPRQGVGKGQIAYANVR